MTKNNKLKQQAKANQDSHVVHEDSNSSVNKNPTNNNQMTQEKFDKLSRDDQLGFLHAELYQLERQESTVKSTLIELQQKSATAQKNITTLLRVKAEEDAVKVKKQSDEELSKLKKQVDELLKLQESSIVLNNTAKLVEVSDSDDEVDPKDVGKASNGK